MKDGTPKYYDKKIYPVDIHCPAQLWNTLYELNLFKNHKIIAEKVYNWTITNLYNKNGYFYYQKNRFFKSKISYMRWSNAFVLKGLSCLSFIRMKFEKLNGYKVFAPNKDDLTDFTNIKNKILIAMNANKILRK